MTTWTGPPCPRCGPDELCETHRPRGRGGLRLAARTLAPEPGPAAPAPIDTSPRYRATKMGTVHGKNCVIEWTRGTAQARLIACPMRSLEVPGEPYTRGQWSEAAWMTYLVWETGQDPMDGGLLERHFDRVRDTVTWHPVGSATVTGDLGEAVRLVLSITDARTWEA